MNSSQFQGTFDQDTSHIPCIIHRSNPFIQTSLKYFDPSYLTLVTQWIHIQGKNAEGWLGIEKKNKDWVYSKSGEEVDMSSDFWHKGSSGGKCVYLKGEKGKWMADSCGEVRGFICEFKGTLFCMIRKL